MTGPTPGLDRPTAQLLQICGSLVAVVGLGLKGHGYDEAALSDLVRAYDAIVWGIRSPEAAEPRERPG